VTAAIRRHRRRAAGRAGGGAAFTLVELVTAIVLVAGAVLVVWALYTTGSRQVVLSQMKLDAVRGAHLLFEVLHRDLVGARSVLVVPPPPAAPDRAPPPSLFFVDGKEYLLDRATGALTIAGEPWLLCGYEDVSLRLLAGGRARLRIAAVSHSAPRAGGPGSGAARAVIESDVTIEVLRGKELFPFTVEEHRQAHNYCMEGDPVDY
jgi:hypothetical protein